jgi:hypothetical protein
MGGQSTSTSSPTQRSGDKQPISDADLRLIAQSSPAGLALASDPKWTLPPHIDLIDQLLVRVAAGELRRLIVTVPVRHGKSEMCSRYFPAWLVGMRLRPDCKVVVEGRAVWCR